jgi:hypothetical protein
MTVSLLACHGVRETLRPLIPAFHASVASLVQPCERFSLPLSPLSLAAARVKRVSPSKALPFEEPKLRRAL